jgi:putative redox protein
MSTDATCSPPTSPKGLGGGDTGPAPHELLPVTLASCISTTIALYARRRQWKLDGLRIDVAYDTEATPRPCDTAATCPRPD